MQIADMSGKFHNSIRNHPPVPFVAAGMHQDSDRQALHAPVLVLNASYEPINVCAARRAIVLVLKGVAMTIVAAMLGLSRVAAGLHYPSDVLAGAIVGLVVGRRARGG